VKTLRHAGIGHARRALAIAALAQASSIALGCKRQSPVPAPPVASTRPIAAPAEPAPIPAVTIDAGKQPVSFYLQLAVTPEERANGLVGRPTLAVDAGLLFVFDDLSSPLPCPASALCSWY
jgi:cell division septation protein DedD